MTTLPSYRRQITALALTIAAWLTLTPGGAFASEPIQMTASMAVAGRAHTATAPSDGIPNPIATYGLEPKNKTR